MAFKHSISLVTYLAANLGCDRFRITPDIISKLFRTAICRHCAVLFKAEQTLFPQTGRWFRSIALRRIRLGTCSFVPKPYFCSETNDWLQDWATRLAWLWLVTTSSVFHRKFNFTWKKALVAAQNLQCNKTFTLESVSQEWQHIFLKQACRGELSQELGCWFCPLNLWLPLALEQPLERLQGDWQGLKLVLKLELCRLTNEL